MLFRFSVCFSAHTIVGGCGRWHRCYGSTLSIIILSQVSFVLHLTCGNYTVTVDLITYQNPSHGSASGGCCDISCSNYCENRFTFCYSDSESATQIARSLQERPEEVLVGCQLASGLFAYNVDSIIFPSSGTFGGTVENPLELSGDV